MGSDTVFLADLCPSYSLRLRSDGWGTLLTTVAGIRPASPRFKTVTIAPALGALKHVSVAYPSPHGEILAEYTLGGAGTSAKVTLPLGLTGTLRWGVKSYPQSEGTNTIMLQRQNSMQRSHNRVEPPFRSKERDRETL